MFKIVKQQLQENFQKMLNATEHLFYVTIDRETVWDNYLQAFEIEEQQGHNCNCCKSFLRQYSGIVAIIDGKRASKQKLRFPGSKGPLSTEDLWELNLESLDTLAISIDKQLESTGTESFIGKRNTTNTLLELQLEILKHVIEFKLAEKDVKAKRAEKSIKIAKLKDALMEDENKELVSMSKEDKLKMLADLQAED